MKNFSIKDTFDSEIKGIWLDEKFKEIEVINRGFTLPKNLSEEAILFIGINPSFDEKDNLEYYDLNQESENHPYFNKFSVISKEVKVHWSHFDLLFFRETNQSHINTLLRSKIGVEFIYRQLEISKKVILQSKPKIIIVSNTMARHFMGFDKNIEKNNGVWMNFDFEFDEEIGTHRIINHKELNNVPVFFTSMLSGQRALDVGSFKRLIWHIKFVLKKI